ncbi:thioredoxin family protein [Ideonella dechloratans]|uniref:Thioredoxin family protein n=1 Tax=Ideonella dechloratans TaxID=36863 RepID=A0A643F8C6_IDEDE|nr:thioredoxin family protein [Ideonella dechloratans]KAB0577484.1 thioredoxin family protein [Ideonella dechloratans]UFU10015.1 thioredoxin family protein [Ideonella dechloratans]
MSTAESSPSSSPALLLACLCAAWCPTCVSYQEAFQALAAQHPEARLVWIDIEDHADALEAGDEDIPDIENFPTLLLLRDGQAVFHGTVLPHAQVAERLLQQAPSLRPLADASVRALARAVAGLAADPALDMG